MMLQIAQRIGIPFALLFLAGLYFLEVMGGKAQDLMLIKPVFYLMVLLFCINAVTDMRDILKQKDHIVSAKADPLTKILPFAGLAILLVAGLPYAGFCVSSIVFLFLVLFMFKVESKAVLVLMPLIVSTVLYLLFVYAFGVELPVGFLDII